MLYRPVTSVQRRYPLESETVATALAAAGWVGVDRPVGREAPLPGRASPVVGGNAP